MAKDEKKPRTNQELTEESVVPGSREHQAMGTLPPPEEWPQRPLLLRWSPSSVVTPLKQQPINSSQSIPFETEHFKGCIHLAIRYCPNEELDPWSKAQGGWMEGKQRKVVVYVSGEFKTRLAFSDVVFGFVWNRPLLPPPGIGLAMNICDRFSPGLTQDVVGQEPYMLNTVAGSADMLHIWKPGDPESEKLDPNRPHLLYERPVGDIPKFKKMKDRANWMAKKHPNGGTNADNLFFEPGHIYSMEFYTHLLFMHLFEVWFPITPKPFESYWKVKLADYFNGQSYPVIAKVKSTGAILWDLEVWHEKATEAAPAYMWRKGPKVPEPEAAVPAPAPEPAPPVARPLHDDPHFADDTSDQSFISCQEHEDFGYSVDDEDDDEDDSADSADEPASPLPPGVDASDTQSPDALPLVPPQPSAKDDHGKVLWPGKRLREAPRESAKWASNRHEIPQGCQVVILEAKSHWSKIEILGSGSEKKRGWIKTRHLGKSNSVSLSGPEPRVGTITAKRKRVRAKPQKKARKHGPHLPKEEEVSVLSIADKWVLIVPATGPAGWIKAEHIRVHPDTPEAE